MLLRDASERDSLYRDLREQDPDIWEPACHRLGEMAAADKVAYRVLCDLLLSSAPELRLRGLVALRILAPAKPVEVGRFLTDRVAEARVQYDPVLLDVTFFAFTALPKQAGKDLVAGYLTDPHEGIRAAAAAALCFWPDWPTGTLEKMAGDSSLDVRAGLITALAELEDSTERSRALEILKRSNEPLLEELLGELDQDKSASPQPSSDSGGHRSPRTSALTRPGARSNPGARRTGCSRQYGGTSAAERPLPRQRTGNAFSNLGGSVAPSLPSRQRVFAERAWHLGGSLPG